MFEYVLRDTIVDKRVAIINLIQVEFRYLVNLIYKLLKE